MTTKLVRFEDGKIVLPDDFRDWASSGEQLVAIFEDDTIIIKRIRKPPLTEIARQVPEEPEMPLQEIAAEVHKYREEKRGAGRS
ncbi:hypothetical protein [Fervidibacter sacchari]